MASTDTLLREKKKQQQKTPPSFAAGSPTLLDNSRLSPL